jgi:hypothetical protein
MHGFPLLYPFSDAFNPTVRIWLTTSYDAEQFFSQRGSYFALMLGGKAIGPCG